MNIYNNINNFIKNRIEKDIDQYNLSLSFFYNNIQKYKYYKNLFLFIVYKNNKIYVICNNGDNRKQNIIKIVTNIILKLKKNNNLPDFFLPFYVSDTYFYQNNDLPFFIEAKPKNKKGILYPDQNYYFINMNNEKYNYDQFKEILKEKKCSDVENKKPIIYFSGANTGSDKHNIRYKFKEYVSEFNNKNYDIHISETYVPMYYFCSYKYLLNLPGHQPWSYRMTKILLMNSLIFDVVVYQKYIIENKNSTKESKNDKWIQFYSEYFIPNEDYIEINYDWTEGITPDIQTINIYNKCNELFNYYEKNNKEYIRITNNATKKAYSLNTDIFNKTFEHLILYFTQKIYEHNTHDEVNTFINNIMSFDANIIETEFKLIKNINNIEYNYFLTKQFLYNILHILPTKSYKILSFGYYDIKKIKYIYENIIKFNNKSELTIFYNNKINYIINDQIKYIDNNLVDKNYDYIFLFEIDYKKDLFKNLILLWNKLNYNGFIIIELINSNNENNINISKDDLYFNMFKNLFKYEIKIFYKISKYIIIHKYNLNEINKNISNNIIKLINNYIKDFPKEFTITLPKQTKKIIKWNFILTKNKIKIHKEINQKYNKYFNKNIPLDIIKFDLNYFNVVRTNKYINELAKFFINTYKNLFILDDDKNIDEKIKNIVNILNIDENKPIKHHLIFFENLIKYCPNKIKIFDISYLQPIPSSLKKLSQISHKLKSNLNINYPLHNIYNKNLNKIYKNNPILNNKIKYKYILTDENIFNFDNIINITNKYNNNVDIIEMDQFFRIQKLSTFSSINYNIYICMNLLYLILSLQKKNGSLFFSNISIVSKPFIQFIYILNNYYDEVKITNYNDYRHQNSIYIICNNFRGITKNELKLFYEKYYNVYNKSKKYNFYNNKHNIMFIESICDNIIPNNIINNIKKYNTQLYKDIHTNIDYKIKINKLFESSNNKIKKYIFEKIFEKQYLNYIEYNYYIDNIYKNFIYKCTI